MENFAKDFISILQYLLPGFVSAWVFYGLTSYPKPSQFERVVQAMIFTLFNQSVLTCVELGFESFGKYYAIAKWTNSSNLVWSIIIALPMGLVFSYFANNDKLHSLLRKLKITREGSYPTEWFKAFLNVTYVVLHLTDGRRLYGWPIEWPSSPTEGHFLIEQPSWLLADGKEEPILRVKNILVNVVDVKLVEFLEKTWEEENG